MDDFEVDILIAKAREATKVQIDFLEGHPFPFNYQSYHVQHRCAAPKHPRREFVANGWMATKIR